MEDIKKQYEILGLPEFADKEEVENRYSLLLRRERARQKLDQGSYSQNEIDFDQITAAYKKILAYEDQKYTDAFNEKEYGKYKGMSEQAQKIDHFWRYYKFHTLGSLLLIGLIIYGIIAYNDHLAEKERIANLPPLDISIMFMGNYGLPDSNMTNETIDEALITALPDWSRFESQIIYVPRDEISQAPYLQKAVVMLASEKNDLYVLDDFMLNYLGNQGAFLNLEDDPELAPLLNEQNSIKFATEDDPVERIYVVDLSKTKFVDDIPVIGPNFYVGVRFNGEHPERAKQFIKHYLENAES